MNLVQLQYFAAVVEEGSISAAARRLHLSQPPLSIQIRNLETEYGVRLLDRGARRARVTPAGEVLYEYAVRILEMTRAAEDDLESLKAGQRTSLRLGIISSGECPELLQGLAEFRRQYPDIAFQIFDRNTYELQQDIEKQRIDLAVIRTPFQTRSLESVVLRRESFFAAGTPELLSGAVCAPNGRCSLAGLSRTPIILYRRWQNAIREEAAKEGAKLNILCMSDDARTCVQWARAGIGVALVPESVLLLTPELARRELSEDTLRTKVCLIRRTDRSVSGSAEKLFHFFSKRAEAYAR
ncbi:MAG: LysR family transcriptional regulator [Lachnospira sp.]|nr:LysR family transcriptional regulator [Lachnospira sp.]